MLNALKKTNKRLLYVLGILILLPIIVIIFLAIIQSCGNRKVGFSSYNDKMLIAGEKYFKESKKDIEIGQTEKVSLSTLVSKEYIKPSEKALDDSSCTGDVIRRRTTEEDIIYTSTLKCDKYKDDSITLNDSLINNAVSEGSGLYKTDEGYIFKGDEPDNYMYFYGTEYRIMSIDNDGILKLLKVNSENHSYWDNKYNVDVEKAYGKNIYADSSILKKMNENIYNKGDKKNRSAKKYILPYGACIGKRSTTDYRISIAVDCSEKLENQYVMLPNVSDFALASLDPDCKDLTSKSCRNYNYLKDILGSTWTMNPVSETSYQVFMIANGTVDYSALNSYSKYNVVIHIDGNVKTKSGDGSKSSPYVIE